MTRFRCFLLCFFIIFACIEELSALEVYKEKATASFYGKDFHGKKTSNGETFNMYAYTCANKELPFNTILKVTNLANGKTVEVRVNDRGPFVSGRTVDLSTQAAIDLGMTKTGLAQVKLEIVKKGPDTKLSRDTAASAKKIMAKIEGTKTTSGVSTSQTPQKVEKPVEPGKIWDIQVASFSKKENATAFGRKLSKQGFKNIVLQTTKSGVVRVVVSRVKSENLNGTKKKLADSGYTEVVIKERKN